MFRRFPIALVVLVASAMACDASVAGIDGVDAGHIERLARITNRSLTPVEQTLLAGFGRLQTDSIAPALPQLQTLFDLVLDGETVRSEDHAAEMRRQHTDAIAHAWTAIDEGRTGPGQRGLIEARALQVRLTAEGMGPMSVRAYVALVGACVDQLEQQHVVARKSTHDHLLGTARNLAADARMFVAAGDMVAAVDVASHAAGLLNTLLPATSPK